MSIKRKRKIQLKYIWFSPSASDQQKNSLINLLAIFRELIKMLYRRRKLKTLLLISKKIKIKFSTFLRSFFIVLKHSRVSSNWIGSVTLFIISFYSLYAPLCSCCRERYVFFVFIHCSFSWVSRASRDFYNFIQLTVINFSSLNFFFSSLVLFFCLFCLREEFRDENHQFFSRVSFS